VAKIIRREIRERGFFGWLFTIAFFCFNLLMAVWLFSYWASVGELMNNAGSDAARAGGAIGATLGTGMLLTFWMAGAIILGLLTLFTRGKLTVIEERVEA
jgi:hypothetical protein